MARRFDLVVFDWDGTLIDSTSMIVQSIQSACRDLGVPIPDDTVASYVIGLGLHDALAHAVPSLRPDQVPLMAARYRSHYLAHDESLQLFAGVPEMLAELKGEGRQLAVATGKTRVGLDRALRHAGLVEQFDATRTADESRPKPQPQMLEELTNWLGVEPARALMVGDTTHDLLMAANARVAAVAICHGAHARSELVGLQPLGLVDDIAALRTWIRQNG